LRREWGRKEKKGSSLSFLVVPQLKLFVLKANRVRTIAERERERERAREREREREREERE
jgi:hypothetical protein